MLKTPSAAEDRAAALRNRGFRAFCESYAPFDVPVEYAYPLLQTDLQTEAIQSPS